VKSGYDFALLTTNNCAPAAGIKTTYDYSANPISAGVTGQRYFCTDLSGVIQYKASAAFTDSSGVCSAGTPI
jgi:hypothetical protein